MISTKNIPVNERLIVALDVDTPDEAKELVIRLTETVVFYKIGLQLFMAGGYFELIDWLYNNGKKIFVDLKFFDIPETVSKAVSRLQDRNVSFTTVHGNDKILRAAVQNKGNLKILAVTVLTSLDEGDLRDLGFQCDVETLVLSRARRAAEIGCDGIVSSGIEAKKVRNELGNKLLIVTPGIRPISNDIVNDDQKRAVNVKTAFHNGADYIVLGRPIRNSDNPQLKALEIQTLIYSLFSNR